MLKQSRVDRNSFYLFCIVIIKNKPFTYPNFIWIVVDCMGQSVDFFNVSGEMAIK